MQRAVYVTDNAADARAAAEEARWNMRVTLSLRNHYEHVERGRAVAVPGPKEPDTDDLLDRFLVIGTPDTVIRQITRVKEMVGITHFNCSFWFGDLEHPAHHEVDDALRQRGAAGVPVRGWRAMAYWLVKSEPDDWSWTEQVAKGRAGAEWTGIRNFAAQKHLRAMKKGEQAFFYHTGKERAIVGIVKVIAEAHPDSTDAAWGAVDVAAVRKLPTPVTLDQIKARSAPRRHGAGQDLAPVGAAGDGGRVADHHSAGWPRLRPAGISEARLGSR